MASWITNQNLQWPRHFDCEVLPFRDRSWLTRCTVTSGIKTASLSTLPPPYYFEYSPCGGVPPPSAALTLFKCIRRYATRHVLGNRVHLLIWVATWGKAPEHREMLDKNPFARSACALMNWMQASWASSLVRIWYLKSVKRDIDCRPMGDPTTHWGPSTQRTVLRFSGNESVCWIGNWAFASELLDLWPSETELNFFASDIGYVEATYRRHGRRPIEWWAWLQDGRLSFGAHRRCATWEVAKRTTKAERVARDSERSRLSQTKLRCQMEEPAVWRRCDGGWTTKSRQIFDESVPIKRARLLLGDERQHWFGVAKLPAAEINSRTVWAVRSLRDPVGVYATQISEGVGRLKTAIREYRRRFVGSGIQISF